LGGAGLGGAGWPSSRATAELAPVVVGLIGSRRGILCDECRRHAAAMMAHKTTATPPIIKGGRAEEARPPPPDSDSLRPLKGSAGAGGGETASGVGCGVAVVSIEVIG